VNLPVRTNIFYLYSIIRVIKRKKHDIKRLIPFMMILIGLCACSQGIPVVSTSIASSGIKGYMTAGPKYPGPVRIGDTGC
jgi:hypothetical protein